MQVTISVVSGAGSTDVLVEAAEDTPAVEVEAALRRLARTPGGAVRVEHPLLGAGAERRSWDEAGTLRDVGLVQGARVVLGDRPDPDREHEPEHEPGLELRVVSGPDAGSVHRLAPGDRELGRSGPVAWQDHSLSRRHCRLRLDEGGAAVSVTDLGSSNGTRLDGEPCPPHEPRPWRPGQVLAVGDSLVELHPAPAHDAAPVAAPTSAGDGHLVWGRPPPRPASYAPQPPPDPAQVGACATPAGRGWPRRWERRRDDPDHLLLRLGTVGHRGAPVTLPLGGLAAGDTVGLVGPDATVDAALRWWLLQLAALHAPDDLSLDVVGHRVDRSWSWLRWLPHRAGPPGPRPHLTVHHGATAPGPAPGPAPAGPLVVTGAGLDDLPERCAAVVEVGAHQPSYARLSRPGAPVVELRLDGVAAGWADRVARSLAPLVLPGAPPAPPEPGTAGAPGLRVRPLPWTVPEPAADWPSSRGRV
ncbi:hypothetical protein BKA08_000437 [Nocardioides marinisabuli]|uniref:FHA domain-containing protein n=1 Tax=Nocardioides marinisabuli TaxID=419476 RepID=A0A7Y9JQZ4_9ACTN|nr:hypothetical protein [Nocardioides marinisabuli]